MAVSLPAAAGGSLAAVCAVLSASWGVWQEWWLATLSLAVFAIIAMARAAAELAVGQPAIRTLQHGMYFGERILTMLLILAMGVTVVFGIFKLKKMQVDYTRRYPPDNDK